MKLTKEDKKYILDEHLRNISHISDKEYQKRVWIRGEGPECDDFDETVCHFFDDGDPILKSYKNYGITESQYHWLIQFRDAFNAFVHSPNAPCFAEEFIDTSEWEKIVEMAQEVLKAFHFSAPKRNASET